ncbi:hypothetical protein FE257_007724 [Aspergillus nanangensis]|uniref:C2H2-type domain-containing protein n=1 Tax=Aspergillus nanangensis TaxID=2582783 RepID=A0AAD4GYP5_ASPNN|nr:hypothetical protein FE257_007724 [Aspergillus nanangensis]
MSASPQFVRNDSPTNMTFHDTFLSPAFDPDEASFKSAGIRLTSVNPDDNSLRDLSSSPLPNNGSTNGDGHPGSYSSFLSPTDEFSSNFSANTSPGADFMSDTFHADTISSPNGWSHGMQDVGSDHSGMVSPQATMNPADLLSPNYTNHPGFSSVKSEHSFNTDPPPMLTLITTPPDDRLGVDVPDSAMVRSPIVKVESVSRGDSPDRLSFYSKGRSSAHLSPGDQSSDSGDEGRESRFLSTTHSVSRGQDGSWVPDAATGQAGVEPSSRGQAYVPSPNDMQFQRELDDRNADIRIWSATVSAANSEAGEVSPYRGRKEKVGSRRRAKSAGDPSAQQDYFSMQPTGRLVYVSSDDESESGSGIGGSASESPVEGAEKGEASSSPQQQSAEPEDVSPTSREQPQTSSEAMVAYQRRARDFDNLSRVATWGTRPISQADIDSIIGDGGSFGNLTLSNDKHKKHQRQRSLRKFLQIKPTNNLKRQLSDLSSKLPTTDVAHNKGEDAKSPPQRKDSFPHLSSLRRGSRSPSLSQGFMAMTNPMITIGHGSKNTMKVTSPTSSTSPSWPSLKVRTRSRSDVRPNPGPGLFELMRNHGGPPVANITTYSPQAIETRELGTAPRQAVVDEDEDDEEMVDEKALVMEFPVQSRLPVPTLEGFKSQVLQLNPRLPPALIERFANEQLRRYKKLVECKQSHTKAVRQNTCAAGNYCFSQGGEAKLLAPRTNAVESDAAHTQFQIPGHGETDNDPHALGEGAVTAAQFPQGVPLPPVKRLPAEFECPICFQVKKFQKPSDWTKHVHEDVQPFTCTFPSCPDPKSFKRKADWVRHESERHRHLEWWTCSSPDCSHTCFRKDNFVQHLVREHKMPEPKVKKTKSKGAKKGNNGATNPDVQEEINREREIERLWDLVEKCRHDTAMSPREEPCRFCGNVCSSWKKLTVHLAKHMEQIAMPVLGLVKERDLPYHAGGGGGGGGGRANADESVVHETRGFAPRLEGVQAGPDMSMNLTTPTPYTTGPNGGLAAPFNPTYAPHLTTMPDGIISEEPESMDAFDSVSYGAAQTGMQLGVPTNPAQFIPIHQNSVTYPPAGPRLKVSDHDLNGLHESYHYSVSPPEMNPPTYDGQASMYMSATTSGPMAQSMSYDPSQGYYHPR